MTAANTRLGRLTLDMTTLMGAQPANIVERTQQQNLLRWMTEEKTRLNQEIEGLEYERSQERKITEEKRKAEAKVEEVKPLSGPEAAMVLRFNEAAARGGTRVEEPIEGEVQQYDATTGKTKRLSKASTIRHIIKPTVKLGTESNAPTYTLEQAKVLLESMGLGAHLKPIRPSEEEYMQKVRDYYRNPQFRTTRGTPTVALPGDTKQLTGSEAMADMRKDLLGAPK